MNTDLLKQKAEMLEEYFCIHIDTHGNLARLPVVLDQYTPDMDRVPEFALCLGNDVGSTTVVPYHYVFLFALFHIFVFTYFIFQLFKTFSSYLCLYG